MLEATPVRPRLATGESLPRPGADRRERTVPAGARRTWAWGGFVIVLIIFALAVDGAVSRTEALDRWVGTATVSSEGITLTFDFTVLVDPATGGASWEWRYAGVVVASGPLSASVSGSTVNGSLFFTGGTAFDVAPGDYTPCNFTGTIVGNQVNGTLDQGSCGGTGTFVLAKQQ